MPKHRHCIEIERCFFFYLNEQVRVEMKEIVDKKNEKKKRNREMNRFSNYLCMLMFVKQEYRYCISVECHLRITICRAFFTFSFIRSSWRTSAISFFQPSCIVWNDSFGVSPKPDKWIASSSRIMSLNVGRLCGSFDQQAFFVQK